VAAPGDHDGEQEEVGGRRLARGEGGASPRVIRVRGPASPYDPSYHLLLNTRKIRAIVDRERPDVLEIHSPYMAAVGALRADPSTYGVRTFQWHSDFIDTYGGVLEDKAPFLPSPLVRTVTRPLWSLVRSIARRCDATLVASAWQVGKLTAHGVPNVVHRPFGIERSIFRTDARAFEARRDMLALAGRDGMSDTTRIVVGVGRFAIEKRWDLVIDAFSKVRARGTDAILVLFGDGPERERMKERARSGTPSFPQDIVFPGFTKGREALARSLASADVLLHGCPFETFGLSIAEAMSCGLPAVVPDDGGAAEMHDPESGEIYAAGDVDACAAALERILERIARDSEPMRGAAARAAGRLPSVEDQFAEQIALYTDLIARRSANRDR
jgi:alpha-1,6-mannosyltransferase